MAAPACARCCGVPAALPWNWVVSSAQANSLSPCPTYSIPFVSYSHVHSCPHCHSIPTAIHLSPSCPYSSSILTLVPTLSHPQQWSGHAAPIPPPSLPSLCLHPASTLIHYHSTPALSPSYLHPCPHSLISISARCLLVPGCSCNPLGTDASTCGPQQCHCDRHSGQCHCLPHVEGQSCDRCSPNFWNLASGQGCQPCACHPQHSLSPTCNQVRHGRACGWGMGWGWGCSAAVPAWAVPCLSVHRAVPLPAGLWGPDLHRLPGAPLGRPAAAVPR